MCTWTGEMSGIGVISFMLILIKSLSLSIHVFTSSQLLLFNALAEHPRTVGSSIQEHHDIHTSNAPSMVAATPKRMANIKPSSTHQVVQRGLLRLSDHRSILVTGAGLSISSHKSSNRAAQCGNFLYRSSIVSGLLASRGSSCGRENVENPSPNMASILMASLRMARESWSELENKRS